MADGIGVGYGARPYADGIDAVYFVAQENYPVEFLELGYPVRLRRYGIVQDSGGAGRFRGGCGIVREYEILAEEAVLAVRIDSVVNPPWGVAGGMSGGAGRAVVNPGTPQRARAGAAVGRQRAQARRHPAPRDRRRRRPRPSHDRPVEDVLADVLGGFVSREAAAKHYGVVVAGELDEAATAALRATRPPVKAFHRNEYVDALV